MNYLASYQTSLVCHFTLIIMLIYDLNKNIKSVLFCHYLAWPSNKNWIDYLYYLLTYHFSMSPSGGLGSDKHTYMYMFCGYLLVCLSVCLPLCLCTSIFRFPTQTVLKSLDEYCIGDKPPHPLLDNQPYNVNWIHLILTVLLDTLL